MNKLRSIFLIFLLACTGQAFSQQRQYLLYFSDKGFYKNADARSCLSAEAIQKRMLRGIAVSYSDMPLSHAYLQALSKSGISIQQTSRWLNMVKISSSLGITELMQQFPFVSRVQEMEDRMGSENGKFLMEVMPADKTFLKTAASFGATDNQNSMLNLQCLHDQGYTGRGVTIAIFDTGFQGVDTIAAYDSARLEGRFIATRNFVIPSQTVYSTDAHGALVFSTIAGYIPGAFVGTAPGASYALAITEKLGSETHQEELNWLAAAEWADSLGADVIQSSLTYRNFDPGEGDYSYAQLDGKTAIITQAARIAASKGIIVVNSAGNDGNSPTPVSRKASPPCDADSILCVGSVNSAGLYHSLASIGPTSDGRIKPDVTAMGQQTACLNNRGTLVHTDGTSLSTPLISGLAACLKQAHPQRSGWAIIYCIMQTADRAQQPDTFYGYGIPDACKADSMLNFYTGMKDEMRSGQMNVYPNPVSSTITIRLTDPFFKAAKVCVINMNGQIIRSQSLLSVKEQEVSLSTLLPGLYLIQVDADGKIFNQKIVKH